MKFHRFLAISALLVGLVPSSVLAATTMDSIWVVPHEQPTALVIDAVGFYGSTESGELFMQRPLVTDPSIRIHKFTIGSAFFYVSDRGFIKASSDLVAISMYLARG